MKVVRLEPVKVKIPSWTGSSHGTKSWHDTAPRALPINIYRDFPPSPPRLIPGAVGAAVWVQATAEDGTTGLGRCRYGDATAAVIRDYLAPVVVGRDCLATDMINDIMCRVTKRMGSGGLAAIARSGVDLALWDLKAKLLGVPVYRLAGGGRTDIDCYCTTDDLEWGQELGFNAFKISNPATFAQGDAGLAAIEAKVADARKRIGDASPLMLNAIMSYDVAFTIRVAERLRAYGLWWLEEPLVPDDLGGHLALRDALPWLTLATGEDHHGVAEFGELIEARCINVIQPDLELCGGFTEALRVATLASAFGISVSPHMGGNSPFGQHFLAAIGGIEKAEFHLSAPPGVPLKEFYRLPGMPLPEAGVVKVSDAPGFGLSIESALITPWFEHG